VGENDIDIPPLGSEKERGEKRKSRKKKEKINKFAEIRDEKGCRGEEFRHWCHEKGTKEKLPKKTWEKKFEKTDA